MLVTLAAPGGKLASDLGEAARAIGKEVGTAVLVIVAVTVVAGVVVLAHYAEDEMPADE